MEIWVLQNKLSGEVIGLYSSRDKAISAMSNYLVLQPDCEEGKVTAEIYVKALDH